MTDISSTIVDESICKITDEDSMMHLEIKRINVDWLQIFLGDIGEIVAVGITNMDKTEVGGIISRRVFWASVGRKVKVASLST